MTYQDFTPAKWHALDAEMVRAQVLPRGYSDIYEKECRRKDGTLFPVELRVFLAPDEAEEPAGMWAIIRDITKRKQAEELVQQISGRLLQVQDEERRRLARELHDTLAQDLAALSINLNWAACRAKLNWLSSEFCRKPWPTSTATPAARRPLSAGRRQRTRSGWKCGTMGREWFPGALPDQPAETPRSAWVSPA